MPITGPAMMWYIEPSWLCAPPRPAWRDATDAGGLSDASLRIHEQPAFVDECPRGSMTRIEAPFDPRCGVVPVASLSQRRRRCASVRHPMAQLETAREELQPTLVRIVHTGHGCKFISRSIEIEQWRPRLVQRRTYRELGDVKSRCGRGIRQH